MVNFRFKLNPAQYRRFKAAIAESCAEVISTISDEFDAVIEDPNEFSDLGFTNHDIVDTGRLRDSKRVTVVTNKNGTFATFDWSPVSPDTGERYAPKIYKGFMAYGRKYIPGRPWPERAIARVDPLKALQAEMKIRGIPAKVRRKLLR